MYIIILRKSIQIDYGIGSDSMIVRQATLEDFDQMATLIHKTAKKHIEKNVYQWRHCCEDEVLRNEILNGQVFILEDKNRLIGSYSIKPLEADYPVQIEKSYMMYRLIIHPFFQEKDISDEIFKHVRHKYKKKDILMDCWAGNEKTFNFYKNHDCIFLGDYPAMDYKISVFQVGKHGIFKDKRK